LFLKWTFTISTADFVSYKAILLNLVMLAVRGLFLYVYCKILFVFLIVTYNWSSLKLIYIRVWCKLLWMLAKSKWEFCKRCNNRRQNELWNIYSCLKFLEVTCNQVYRLFLPQALLLGGHLLVFSNYGTIHKHSVILLPYYLRFQILASLIILVVLSIFPPCSKIHENSEACLGITRTLNSGGKNHVTKAKS